MKQAILLIIILLLSIKMAAQNQNELRLSYNNVSLSEILFEFKTQISFNAEALSKYKINVEKNFKTIEKALDYLLKKTDYKWEKINEVYVIYKKPQKSNSQKADTKKKKKVTAKKAKKTKQQRSNISTPTIIESISEVIISGSNTQELSSNTAPGEISSSQKTAENMPGSPDNSVFNLLRMLPSVRASGEPDVDMIIWSSRPSESKIDFEGIHIFETRGFNNNISFINPYLIKNIKLYKGAYNATMGLQNGAIAKLEAKMPDLNKPSIKANVSTLTANIFASLPISKRSGLAIAFRHTLFQLYPESIFNPSHNNMGNEGNGNHENEKNHGDERDYENATSTESINIKPNYNFSDLNIHYSGEAFYNDCYKITIYGADDGFSYDTTSEEYNSINGKERSIQGGASASYERYWNDKNTSEAAISYSILNKKRNNSSIKSSHATNDLYLNNIIQEINAKLSHQIQLGKINKLETGIELTGYKTKIDYISTTIKTNNQGIITPTKIDDKKKNDLISTSIYLNDKIKYKIFSANIGIRADLDHVKLKFQPRISVSINPIKELNITASWGIYNQYLLKTIYTQKAPEKTRKYRKYGNHNGNGNGNGNYQHGNNSYKTTIWDINEKHQNMHSVFGIAYKSKFGLSSIVELYYKKGIEYNDEILGTDIFIKQNFKMAEIFLGYSFNKTNFIPKIGHELKTGTIINLSPFIISANYVYGHGYTEKPYNRLDISGSYTLKLKHIALQTGLSLMNITNAKNIKYSYTTSDEKSPITFYNSTIPFTPIIFLEFIW